MKPSSRLKNFCQLCRKQCRDQNGYICHVNSVSHQRKVQQFKTNPEELITKFSQQMQGKFISLLKSKYPGQPKHLQAMYNEYEQQAKRFIKFSHTKWKNLKQFGEYLSTGDVKNIKIIGAPPDCYITYTVNKTMQFIQKNKKQQLQSLRQKQKELFQKSLQNRIEKQKAYEERQARKFQQEMKINQRQQENIVIPDKLQFKFDNWGDNGKRNAFVTIEELDKQIRQESDIPELGTKKLENNQRLLSQIMSKQQMKEKKNQKERQAENDKNQSNAILQFQWAAPGIIVKIKPHQIDPAFHNKKAQIISITQPYVAKIKIGTATLEIDQAYLQTVIPKIGNEVLVLYGQQKGQKGILQEIDLLGGFGNVLVQGKSVRIPFNYFSKYQENQ